LVHCYEMEDLVYANKLMPLVAWLFLCEGLHVGIYKSTYGYYMHPLYLILYTEKKLNLNYVAFHKSGQVYSDKHA